MTWWHLLLPAETDCNQSVSLHEKARPRFAAGFFYGHIKKLTDSSHSLFYLCSVCSRDIKRHI
ncbi:hypothetical protein HK11_08365 [Acetobacter sp. DmW_043]|nr:hypothetical protein HK11_08365 [Acetobacter sp. DmW_043]